MANTFLRSQEYANTMLLLLKNNLVMGRLVQGEFQNKVSDQNGLTVSVKRPPQFIVKDGATLAEQAIATGSTSIAVNQYKNVHVGVSDLEAVTDYNALMRNAVMRSAASALAHNVDLYLHQQLRDFASHVGTLGNAISTPQQFMRVHTRLMDQSVPDTDLAAVMTYADAAALRGSLLGGNIDGVNKTALESSRVPLISSIQAHATQHISSVTTGTRLATGQAQVNGADQNVDYVDVKDLDYATIILESAGAATTYKRGELFTIAGVYAVNNRSGQTLDFLKQFVVMEDAVSDGAGAVTLKYWPPMIVAGTGGGEADTNEAFATVDSAPANDAVLTFLGAPSTAFQVRAAWQKSAIQLVSVKLETPMSDTASFATDPETGISIRYWRGSDIATGRHVHRWDMLYGAKNVDPRLGVRFSGDAP